jgi:hypothetical protein
VVLQDWTDSAGGLSGFAYTHDTEPKWFSLSLNDATTPLATGQAYVVAGSYGGEVGAPLTTDVVWPCLDKPDITMPTTVAAAASSAKASAAA